MPQYLSTGGQRNMSASCKRYSIIIQCVDPPVPVMQFNTNREVSARKAFEYWKQQEIARGGGGEFSITLYRHAAETDTLNRPKIKVWNLEEDREDYPGAIYAVDYPDSEKLEVFSYMDLMALQAEKEKAVEQQEVG